jgi:hypothetical protein
MELSPKKIEHIVKSKIMPSIEEMDRETLNNLYYLAVKQLEKVTKDYNELLDELNRTNKINTNDSDSESKHVFTPRTYTGTSKSKGIIKIPTADLRITTDRPGTTTPKLPSTSRTNMTWRFLDKKSYKEDMRPNTPPRKTTTTSRKGSQGGKRGKNIKTMRKYLKK